MFLTKRQLFVALPEGALLKFFCEEKFISLFRIYNSF